MCLGTGVDGKVEADSERGDWPLSASWGHQKPHKMRDTPHVVNEGQLAYELLLALQVPLAHAQFHLQGCHYFAICPSLTGHEVVTCCAGYCASNPAARQRADPDGELEPGQPFKFVETLHSIRCILIVIRPSTAECVHKWSL